MPYFTFPFFTFFVISVQLLTNYSVLLHVANDDRIGSEGEFINKNFMQKFDIQQMDGHARSLMIELGRQNVGSKSEIYFWKNVF